MKPIYRGVVALSLVCAVAWPALGQDRKSEQAIKHRRAAFTLMSTYFSRLLQTVEGDRPFDPRRVRSDAQMVEMLSRLPWEGFTPGSEQGDTRAKDDIWLDEAQFKKLGADLEARTSALTLAANTGDIKKLRQAFEQTRDVCTACHNEFRKK